MKAAVRSKYGSPEVLTVKEIDPPIPKDNEVLIRVYATTVNRSDYHVLTGKPFFMRFITGLFGQRYPLPVQISLGKSKQRAKMRSALKLVIR